MPRNLRLDGAVEPNNSFGPVAAGAMNASALQPPLSTDLFYDLKPLQARVST